MSDSVVSPASSNVFAALLHLLDRGDHWLHHAFSDFFSDVPILDRVVWHTNITSRGLLLAMFGLLLLLTLPPLCEKLLRRVGRVEPNFRGDIIPQSFGLVLLVWTCTMLFLDAWLLPNSSDERRLWAGCLAGFAAFGLLDDLLGDKKVKGFRGHFRALLRDHRITTGLVKAVGGLLLALWIGCALHPKQPLLILLTTLLVALAANTMNLLDLRPGRAGGLFCLISACLLIAAWRHEGALSVPSLVYVLIPALIVWERDSRAVIMLGDTGSNLLGAALGLAFSIYTGIVFQIIVCALLFALHLLAERVSLTVLIEKNPILRVLDGMTGLRDTQDRTSPTVQPSAAPPEHLST